MTISRTALVSDWLPGASHATTESGTLTIPAAAVDATLAGANGATFGNDFRLWMLGILDMAYQQYQADLNAAGDTDPKAPVTFVINRAITDNKVQFVISIQTTGVATLPAFG